MERERVEMSKQMDTFFKQYRCGKVNDEIKNELSRIQFYILKCISFEAQSRIFL